ncbi:MAG TPA: FUSC family protein [Acetobacteraceae bacterium]|nr:FUSC family protein [Acetobacteraceae bacterium]
MTLPGLREWVFSAKTFAAAMIALLIALRLGLDRPYWAMLTVYIVTQPLTGATRSKAAYRFGGTLLGAVGAVVLVPNLVNAPVLLTGAMALWTGICLTFALLDRTPRSYLFMLAGYTAAIIGFPTVDSPGTIFTVALARVEETSLGLICSTMVTTLFFPRPVGPVLVARIDAWFADGRAWAVAMLAGTVDEDRARAARRSMAGAAVEIGLLASQLAYDASKFQTATLPVIVLRRRMMYLLPVIFAVSDRLALLRTRSAVTPALQDVMDRLRGWLAAGADGPVDPPDSLRADIDRAEPPIGAASDWDAIVRASLVARLCELADLTHDIRALRRQVEMGSPRLPPLAIPRAEAPAATRYHDWGMTLLSAFAAVLAVLLVCGFWIVSGWQDGASAAIFAAVGCSFFATLDDPAPAILSFMHMIAVAAVLDAVYLFAVLPLVSTWEMLVLSMAPGLLILGTLIARPATFLTGLAIAVNAIGMLALTDTYNAQFANFVNTATASILGMAAAAVLTRIIRSVGAEWTARRLMRAGWRDIAHIAEHRPIPRPVLAALMLDRLGDLVPRLAAADPNADRTVRRALHDLRVGLNLELLLDDTRTLAAPVQARVQEMVGAIGEHYRRQAPAAPAAAICTRIDQAIAAVAAAAPQQIDRLLMSLVGLRQTLFPDAPAYTANPAPVLEPAQ